MEPVPVAGNRLFVMATLAREEGGTANTCPLASRLSQAKGTGQGSERWQEDYLLAGLWYDYSRLREGETLREKYEQAMQGAARLIDAVINRSVISGKAS
jgi:hypothetical protein